MRTLDLLELDLVSGGQDSGEVEKDEPEIEQDAVMNTVTTTGSAYPRHNFNGNVWNTNVHGWQAFPAGIPAEGYIPTNDPAHCAGLDAEIAQVESDIAVAQGGIDNLLPPSSGDAVQDQIDTGISAMISGQSFNTVGDYTSYFFNNASDYANAQVLQANVDRLNDELAQLQEDKDRCNAGA